MITGRCTPRSGRTCCSPADRRFTEVDLRRMLEHATGYRPDVATGRWAVAARHRRRAWEVIVEPLPAEKLLLVITAYPVDASRT